MPAADGPLADAKVCLYTNTPDETFVIDRHPAAPGVAFASACSGHGFKFAPVSAEILADLVTGRNRPAGRSGGSGRTGSTRRRWMSSTRRAEAVSGADGSGGGAGRSADRRRPRSTERAATAGL